MKTSWKIVIGLLVVVTIGMLVSRPERSGEPKVLEEIRRTLREQGMKTELADFDCSPSLEARTRATVLTQAGSIAAPTPRGTTVRRSLPRRLLPEFLPVDGPAEAVVLWQVDELPVPAETLQDLQNLGISSENGWSALRELMGADESLLDAACLAAISGPIKFNFQAEAGKLATARSGVSRMRKTSFYIFVTVKWN